MAGRKPKKDAVKFKIENTEIIIGDTYEIVGKLDRDAPDGFQKFNTTKVLMEGIKEIHSVPFDEISRRWDTGFEETSPCNSSISKSERDALVKAYQTHIKKPYEDYYQVKVDATNNDFWGGNDKEGIPPYIFDVYTGKTFDTNNPKELFDLFHVLKQGKACEPGEKDPILQRTAQYNIKNKNMAVSLQEEKRNNKFDAISYFSTMLAALDPKKDDSLYVILEWMQIANVRGSDSDVLRRLVMGLFENEVTGHDNVKRFLEAYEMVKNPVLKEKMDVFSMLLKLQIKQKLEFKRQQYFLEGQFIGNHLKAAAEKATQDPSTKELIIQAYEKYCS